MRDAQGFKRTATLSTLSVWGLAQSGRIHVENDKGALFQNGGNAWLPGHPDVLELLSTGSQVGMQPIYYGSNHTFLVTLDGGGAGRSLAVYKPARGEYPLYDFPTGTLYRREVGTWLVDALLGWGVVPPTVVFRGRHGVGSLQLYIETRPSLEVELGDLRRLALLDAIVNNADRKAEHCLPGADGQVWGIDHGLTFHPQPKLRTVFWHFAGGSLEESECEDVARLDESLRRQKDPRAVELAELLDRAEWRALEHRVRRLRDTGCFPDPRYKPVPYRW